LKDRKIVSGARQDQDIHRITNATKGDDLDISRIGEQSLVDRTGCRKS